MTNSERAEKIVRDIETHPLVKLSNAERVDAIAYFISQLDEAVDKAVLETELAAIERCKKVREEAVREGDTRGYERGMIYLAKRIGEIREEVWNAAREKAAKVADPIDRCCDPLPGGCHCENVAERIRAMKPDK